MSQAVTKIKSRIKSVDGAYKVTSAMKLVSTVKLKQWKGKMSNQKEFLNEVNDVVDLLLMYAKKYESVYAKENDATKKLYVIVSSTLGLCGSYNNNIFKISDVVISPEDDAIILGGKGIAHYKEGQFTSLPGYEEYSSAQDKDLVDKITSYILNEYKKGTYKEIHIIYTEYKNSLVFLAKDYQLLPLVIENKEENGFGPIIEPTPAKLADEVIPFYLKSIIYAKLLESSVCEQGARSNAMENATNNAKDILDSLRIEFNKARQEGITQEIVEISSAAKSV